MAVQSTHLLEGKKGDSSPQGVVYGEKGNKYHDTAANNVYESLGGSDWRLVSNNDVPLRIRKVKDFTALNEITDFKKGEFIDSEYGTYKCESDYIDYSMFAIRDDANTINNKWSTSTIDDNIFRVGDTIVFDIRANSGDLGSRVDQYIFRDNSKKLGILVGDSSGDFQVIRNNSTYLLTTGIDEDGVSYDNLGVWALPYSKWITITATINSEITVTDFIISDFINLDAKVEIANIKITKSGVTESFLISNLSTDIIGDKGTTFSYNGTGAIATIENVPSDYSFFKVGSKILKAIPDIDGFITPEQLGYDSWINNDGIVTNDFSDYWDGIVNNSIHNLKLTGNNYYTSKELYINNPCIIKCIGNDIISSFAKNDGTIIYTDKNINLLTIKSANVDIIDGVLDVSLVPDYSKKCFTLDINYPISLVKSSISGRGNVVVLQTSGIGGSAVSIDNEVCISGGYATKCNIKGKWVNFNKGLNLPFINQCYGLSFRNQIDFDVYLDGIREPINIMQGDVLNVKATIQDRMSYLNGTEVGIPLIKYYGVNCKLNFRPYDDINRGEKYYFEGKSLVIYGDTLDKNVMSKMNFNNSNVNYQNPIKNNVNIVIPSNQGIISELRNPLFNYGDSIDQVTNPLIKGYKAPDSAWISEGTHLGDAATEGLIEDTTNFIYEQRDNFFTTHRARNATGFRLSTGVITDRDLYFAEIVLDGLNLFYNISNEAIKGLWLKTSNNPFSKIHAIIKFTNGTTIDRLHTVNYSDYYNEDSLFDLITYNDLNSDGKLNVSIEKIIIRIYDVENITSITTVNDVILSLKNYRKTVLYNSGSNNIYGTLAIKGDDSNQHTLQPKASSASTVAELLADLKLAGILH